MYGISHLRYAGSLDFSPKVRFWARFLPQKLKVVHLFRETRQSAHKATKKGCPEICPYQKRVFYIRSFRSLINIIRIPG